MKTRIIGILFAGTCVAGSAACVKTENGDDVADDDGGDGPSTGWTAIPLLDDASDPIDILYHAGNDRVTGIHYASLDEGWIVTEGEHDTSNDGGAVFKATHREVTSIAFSGYDTAISLLGSIDFVGIDPTADGYIALAYASDVIRSTDRGATFHIEKNGPADGFGIEKVLAYEQGPGSFTMVRDTGVVTTTTTPGANTISTDLWAPEAFPSIPSPLPADQCHEGPKSPQVPVSRASVHVSEDGGFIAYAANEATGPAICISEDGGHTFFPRVLNVPADAADFAPTGVLFTSASDGIAWWGNNLYPGAAYIRRTTNGGDSWTAVALPAEIAAHGLELRAGFFAHDGDHGWLAGYDYQTSTALLIRTVDGGKTWELSGGDLAAKVSAAGGGKLWTGFALDADHIWVGGEYGVLLASDHGGE